MAEFYITHSINTAALQAMMNRQMLTMSLLGHTLILPELAGAERDIVVDTLLPTVANGGTRPAKVSACMLTAYAVHDCTPEQDGIGGAITQALTPLIGYVIAYADQPSSPDCYRTYYVSEDRTFRAASSEPTPVRAVASILQRRLKERWNARMEREAAVTQTVTDYDRPV